MRRRPITCAVWPADRWEVDLALGSTRVGVDRLHHGTSPSSLERVTNSGCEMSVFPRVTAAVIAGPESYPAAAAYKAIHCRPSSKLSSIADALNSTAVWPAGIVAVSGTPISLESPLINVTVWTTRRFSLRVLGVLCGKSLGGEIGRTPAATLSRRANSGSVAGRFQSRPATRPVDRVSRKSCRNFVSSTAPVGSPQTKDCARTGKRTLRPRSR